MAAPLSAGTDVRAGGAPRIQVVGRVVVAVCVAVGLGAGGVVVLFRVDGLTRRRSSPDATVFETDHRWVEMLSYWALWGALLTAVAGWPILRASPPSRWAGRVLHGGGAVVAAGIVVLTAREPVESRVTIDAVRGLVITESRSFADVTFGSSGTSNVISLDDITTVRWTYRYPDGQNAELGRVTIESNDDRATTIAWQYPTTVAYELALMIASVADAPMQCDAHGDGTDADTAGCLY